jgi:hypothetical protein
MALAVPVIVGGVAEFAADHRLLDRSEDERRAVNDMLKTAIGFIGISSAIITGIVLGHQQDAQSAGTSNVGAQAAAIVDMSDALALMPSSSSAPVLAKLRAYVRAESSIGWQALEHGRQAPQVDASFRDLEASILAVPTGDDPNQSTLRQTAYGDWHTMSGLRSDRLQIANRELAPELWILFVGTGLITVMAVAGLTGHNRTDRIATLGAALTVGLIFFAAIALSYPFSGSISVSAAPLLHALPA